MDRWEGWAEDNCGVFAPCNIWYDENDGEKYLVVYHAEELCDDVVEPEELGGWGFYNKSRYQDPIDLEDILKKIG